MGTVGELLPRSKVMLSSEERDTYAEWGIDQAADQVLWLTRPEWEGLRLRQQRQLLRQQVRHGRSNIPLGRHFRDLQPSLPAGRFLWSRPQLSPEILARIVAERQRPCQRDEVPETVWHRAQTQLPRVRELAGTFPNGSAGNCFGAVMAAAGQVGAEHQWMQREPFGQFLSERTQPGGNDQLPGTLMVWRSARGVEHAAVTLGEGWAFHKASQTWMTPRMVLPIEIIKRDYRAAGQRLERHRLRE